ncbi:MAG: hypothetical protein ACP5RP_02575 [Candidatus Micrarchaeia archaeon]
METDKKKSNVAKDIIISAVIGSSVALGAFEALEHKEDIAKLLRKTYEQGASVVNESKEAASKSVQKFSKELGVAINNQVKNLDSYLASIAFSPRVGDYLQVEEINRYGNSSIPGIPEKALVDIFRYPSNPGGKVLEKPYIFYTFQGENLELNRIYVIEKISHNGKILLVKDIKNGKELFLSADKTPSSMY